MQMRSYCVAAAVWVGVVAPAWAQFKQGEPGGTKVGKSQTSQWRTGMVIKATGGACRGLVGYVPVPTDWPEQQVSIVKEDISPEVRIHYETVDGGVKLMNVRIGQLAAGQEAKALVTVEICRNAIVPPEKTDIYVLPDVKKLPRDDACLSVAQSEDREPRSEDPRLGQEDRRRQGTCLGQDRSDLRLGARQGEVPELVR